MPAPRSASWTTRQSPEQTPAPLPIRTISTAYRSGPCIPSGPNFKSARSTNSQPATARIRTPVQTTPVMSSCCGSSPSGRAAPRRPATTSTDIGARQATPSPRRPGVPVRWTDASPVADLPDQAWQAQEPERRHAEARREENAGKAGACVDDQQAAADGDDGANKGARDGPFHPAGSLAGAVKCISQPEEAEERADRPQVI